MWRWWRRWRQARRRTHEGREELGREEASPAAEERQEEAAETEWEAWLGRKLRPHHWVDDRPGRCPECGGGPVAEVLLGYVDLDRPDLRAAMERDEAVWWGCLVRGGEPDYVCTACGAYCYVPWGRGPWERLPSMRLQGLRFELGPLLEREAPPPWVGPFLAECDRLLRGLEAACEQEGQGDLVRTLKQLSRKKGSGADLGEVLLRSWEEARLRSLRAGGGVVPPSREETGAAGAGVPGPRS